MSDLGWLRRGRKPELASDKLKPLMLEVCRRIGEQWVSGTMLAVGELEGKSVPLLGFVTSRGGYELLLGDDHAVLIATDTDAEVARYSDINRMSILKFP
jgi:hypothetical protein